MNQFPSTIYRCKKCSRVTSTYPFGCKEEQCPVKKDIGNDIIFGIEVFIGAIVISSIILYSLVAQW